MRCTGTGLRAVIGALVVMCAVSCSGTSTAPRPSASAESSGPAATPVQLQINHAGEPERWRTVATFSHARGEQPDSAFPGIKGCTKATDPPQLHWSVDAATLDLELVPLSHRRYSFATDHLMAIQVHSTQVVHIHVYLWLGVAGAPTTATGGPLLLELDSAGNVASLERVAAPTGSGAQVGRMFCVALDSAVYQWFVTPTRAELRRRP